MNGNPHNLCNDSITQMTQNSSVNQNLPFDSVEIERCRCVSKKTNDDKLKDEKSVDFVLEGASAMGAVEDVKPCVTVTLEKGRLLPFHPYLFTV